MRGCLLLLAGFACLGGAPGAAQADPPAPAPLGLSSWLDDQRTEALPDALMRSWATHRRTLEIGRDRFARRSAREAKDGSARETLVRLLSLLGEHERVVAEVEPVLREDLPRWLALIRFHDDLAGFRAAPAGAALLARTATLVREWRAALVRGVPVVARIESTWRTGVLSEDGARFLPAAPAYPHGLGGVFDARRERALVATGLPIKGTVIDPALHVWDWTDGSTRTLRMESTEDYVQAVSAADGVFVRQTHHRDSIERPHWGGFARVEADGQRVPVEGAAPLGPSLQFWGSGGSWSQPEPPAGWSLEGNILRGPADQPPIELDRQHAGAFIASSIVGSPDGRTLYVATLRSDVTPVRPRPTYILSRVDLATRRSEVVFRGVSGSVVAVFGPDGALYLQNARRSTRVDPATGAQTALRRGVYLTLDLHWSGAYDARYEFASHFRPPLR